ncbi:MAG TPA: hypothetical protein VFK80_00510 [Limnochordia bacterium]|nr:hypothetical protein [Limnochordia bacterium]
MAWAPIETINGRRVVPVCPKRSYRVPAYVQECASCDYLHERTQTHVLCGYRAEVATPKRPLAKS